MLMKSALMALVGLTVMTEAGAVYRGPSGFQVERRQNRGKGKGNNNAGGNAGADAAAATCLAANAVQTGSASTGQNGAVAADGQVNSATDEANFINFCSGQTLTNGEQNRGGSCNGVVMGKIPATNRMVSTVITNPPHNGEIPALQTFNVQVQVANMQLGFFTNATSTYYSAPQDLSGGGTIIGHTHVTIQSVGNSLNPQNPLDASQFVFFKGINDDGNGNGGLQAVVDGGLPAGNYRVCTIAGASNHQPVLMPVAQRGAQDDCKYFTATAGGGGGNNNGNANANAGGNGKGKNNNNAGGNTATTSSAAAAASSAAANNGGNGKKNNNQGKANGGGGGKGKNNNNAATTASAAAADTTTSAAAAATTTAANNGGNGKKNNNQGKTNAGATGKGGKGKGKATNAGRDAASAAGALGGAAPAVTDSGDAARPFAVNGNTFVNKEAAVQRACAIQNNACANAVNSGQLGDTTVADCNAQEQACRAAA